MGPTDTFSSKNIATGLQDILICIEMFFAAIMHVYAFRVDDFIESGYSPLVQPHKVLLDVANVTDIFIKDSMEHMFRRHRTNTSLLQNEEDENDDGNNMESSVEESGMDNVEESQTDDNDACESTPTTMTTKKRRVRKKRKVKIIKNKNGINSKQSNLERDLCDDAAL